MRNSRPSISSKSIVMDLRELQKSYLDNLRKVTEDKLEIGSLVRTVISIEEGLVFLKQPKLLLIRKRRDLESFDRT